MQKPPRLEATAKLKATTKLNAATKLEAATKLDLPAATKDSEVVQPILAFALLPRPISSEFTSALAEMQPAGAVTLPGEPRSSSPASVEDAIAVPVSAPLSISVARQETHLPPAGSVPSQISAAIIQNAGPPETTAGTEHLTHIRVETVSDARPIRPAQVLTLQLDPPDLGTVDIRLRLSGDALRVQIDAGRSETLAMIDRDQHGLRAALESAGYRLDDLTIQSGSLAAPGVRAVDGLRLEPSPVEAGFAPHDQNQNQNPNPNPNPNPSRSPDQSHAFFDGSPRGDGQNQRPPREQREAPQRKANRDRHATLFLRDGQYI